MGYSETTNLFMLLPLGWTDANKSYNATLPHFPLVLYLMFLTLLLPNASPHLVVGLTGWVKDHFSPVFQM